MTLDGWRRVVKHAAYTLQDGDESSAERLVLALKDADDAKQALRDKGYGCTGMTLLETAAEVPVARQVHP